MPQKQLSTLFLEQSSDLIWMIDQNFNLVYANQAYLSLMKEVTGEEKKLNEPIFAEGFGAGYIQKWKAYYQRAIEGEHYEIEEHFYHPKTNEIQYSHVTFKPIVGDNQKIVAVACQALALV
jgi:PAS domain S-box-containing protein